MILFISCLELKYISNFVKKLAKLDNFEFYRTLD